ncbi:unnamed protein product, partial [Brassica rapa subsp. trilocularis]
GNIHANGPTAQHPNPNDFSRPTAQGCSTRVRIMPHQCGTR